ncbi:hypothetical protein BU23DRAFT_254169 [Bimuria novae-zelandiae CBS 107.79]|uniref:C2H2-type domain-containing protein n=1 Tax=Bimuria novae-zelandiae CBS 107.79 TaxID=1447943 RepID=A0A6A5VTQ5_9PLEO|nr:hypothetical protein BU23DRAFT_254169 [Bimuria novae-zelandiae CBS 107.79]
MHPGPGQMGVPSTSFSSRRGHAQVLGNFELPPPSAPKFPSFNTINASQSSQAPTTIASVGNLLTPPNNIPGEVLSPSSGVSTSSAQQTAMSSYHQGGGYMYSPSSQPSSHYGYGGGPQNQYNPARGGLNPPPYEMNQQLPPFTPSSVPSNMHTMSAQHQPHHMMNSQTPVSSSAPQQSPAHAQEPFRPPPTPTYSYPPATTPQQASFPYSTGPSPTHQSPISGGGHMTRMSPAVSHGAIPSIPSNPAPSPHPYQRSYGNYVPQASPVYTNVNNPNGQLSLVGGVHPGMMPGFNSGHAAAMPHFLGHQHQQQPTNDRPFKCDQCPQSFNRNHDLKRHKRIHLAVKPFPCTHCDKSFSRKDALKRHILVKGCGKVASGGDDAKRESGSPDVKAESVDTKTVIHSRA